MTTKTILAGVDGSIESTFAAAMATDIARRAGAPCQLVHAAADFWAALSVPEIGISMETLDQAAVDSARRLMQQSLASVVPPGLRRDLEVRTGRAPLVLADAARRHDAELVVLGGKHRRALARLGGSTITHLVRIGSVPVLATDRPFAPPARVLVAVDLSYAAGPAIEAAERWAALFGARLRVLHAAEPLPVVPGMTIPIGDDAMFRSVRQHVENTIAPLVTYPDAEVVVRPGRAAAVIAAEAAQWRADLIVLGSHGKGWVDRMLIGSTSERLLNVLPAPTLVIPVTQPAPEPRDAASPVNFAGHATG